LTELTSWGAFGETINSEYESPMNGPGVFNGNTPYPDTDQDGMPDFWELGTGSNPNVANNNDPSPNGTGYTRLEDYLNWLADPHGIAAVHPRVHQFQPRLFRRQRHQRHGHDFQRSLCAVCSDRRLHRPGGFSVHRRGCRRQHAHAPDEPVLHAAGAVLQSHLARGRPDQ